MDALPVEVRKALERLPAVAPLTALVWTHGMASLGVDVCKSMLKDDYDGALESAVRLAAASVRLVEYLKQDRP